MLRTLVSAAALGVAAMAAAGGARANPVTILPAFTSTTECVSGALVVDDALACTAAGATASVTASPFASLTATAIGGPSISNGAIAFLSYSYTIDGPDNGPVAVDIFANLVATAVGGPNNVGFASLFDTENHQICATIGQNGCGGLASITHGELTEMETPGVVYTIRLEVEGSEVGGAGNSASGFVDPLILVDASTPNAGLYSIRVSDGIANALPASGTPEPAAWVMLLAGFAGLGAALRRRPLAV